MQNGTPASSPPKRDRPHFPTYGTEPPAFQPWVDFARSPKGERSGKICLRRHCEVFQTCGRATADPMRCDVLQASSRLLEFDDALSESGSKMQFPGEGRKRGSSEALRPMKMVPENACVETWNSSTKRVILPLTLSLISILIAVPARAGGGCHRCDCCGCECECDRVCRVIVGTKTVLKVTYSVECEEICLPGPSKCCGSHWERDANACTGCTQHHRIFDWIPNSGGKICTKRSLVKIETPTQVPSYQWVVQHICPKCAQSGRLSNVAPAAAGEQVAANMATGQPGTMVAASETVESSASAPASPVADPGSSATLDATKPASPGLFVKSKLMALLGK